MITAGLQMLVLVVSAFGFAWYVLQRDKQENPPKAKPEDKQQSIEFPAAEEYGHQGAAMSHL
jgi:hypothetical protein